MVDCIDVVILIAAEEADEEELGGAVAGDDEPASEELEVVDSPGTKIPATKPLAPGIELWGSCFR